MDDWHWEGLLRYLIINYGFSIDRLWFLDYGTLFHTFFTYIYERAHAVTTGKNIMSIQIGRYDDRPIY